MYIYETKHFIYSVCFRHMAEWQNKNVLTFRCARHCFFFFWKFCPLTAKCPSDVFGGLVRQRKFSVVKRRPNARPQKLIWRPWRYVNDRQAKDRLATDIVKNSSNRQMRTFICYLTVVWLFLEAEHEKSEANTRPVQNYRLKTDYEQIISFFRLPMHDLIVCC